MRILSGRDLFTFVEDSFVYKTRKTAPLVKLGIPLVDETIGGLGKGSLGVLGMATGVGKSSLLLSSALNTTETVGVVSTEDFEDVAGSRLAAATTGVDSRLIRTGGVDPLDWCKPQTELLDTLEEKLHFAFVPGPTPKTVSQAAEELLLRGCTLIWFDYLQKVDVPDGDRRILVGRTLRQFSAVCAEGGAACMAVSQFSRKPPEEKPHISWLKESGDIENEARLILLGWRDFTDPTLVHLEISKSTVGGEGVRSCYTRDSSGTLVPVEESDEFGTCN